MPGLASSGVNVTWTEQLDPGASVEPQVLEVMLKGICKSCPMLEMPTDVVPEFVSVKVLFFGGSLW